MYVDLYLYVYMCGIVLVCVHVYHTHIYKYKSTYIYICRCMMTQCAQKPTALQSHTSPAIKKCINVCIHAYHIFKHM